MDAPLSLSNVLTVMIAVGCLSTITPQSRGDVVKAWRLAVPACLAAAQATILLAGVFNATFAHDAEWVLAAIIGGIIGRTRGWTMAIAVDQAHGLVRLQRGIDGPMAAAALIVLAFLDFTSAALESPVAPVEYVSAAAALFAGYLVCRALAIAVRTMRAPHVELIDALRRADTASVNR